MGYPKAALAGYPTRRLGGKALGFWPFSSSDAAPSADTVAARQLHDAAVAAANAAYYGSDADQAAADAALEAAKAANTQRVVQQQQADAAPDFLERLRQMLTGAGKYAALALAGVAAVVILPNVLRAARRNRPRRRRHRGRFLHRKGRR